MNEPENQSTDSRSIMLGIRHRCGQIIQFWIPATWVGDILVRKLELPPEDLAAWMGERGWLDPDEQLDDPADRLKRGMGERGAVLIDVRSDESRCPRCDVLLPWVDIVAEAARQPGSG